MSLPILLALALALQDPPDVTALDLEDLLNARVATASRKEQPLTRVPAAVTVIQGDDLRRMGVRHLPEALRGVPGLQVGRVDSNTWAVSARGFNGTAANKLLVLVDGRSVYSPLHSGVFWDVQDIPMDDVDRIEVVRGPGGSLWGANAINGVINIITKPAADTKGGLLRGGAGTELKDFSHARYGFSAGQDAAIRAYVRHFNHDESVLGADPDHRASDDWFMARTGFRLDADTSERSRLSITADAYDGEAQQRTTRVLIPAAPGDPTSESFAERIGLRGGHLRARWERRLGEASHLAVQAYYDHAVRSTEIWHDVLHTGDLEVLHRFAPLDGHDLNWGVGYRYHHSDFRGRFPLQVEPEKHRDDIVSLFVQDEIVLVQERIFLTLGTKLEHNDYTGVEVQPSVRAAWTPDERHSAWVAASRAVRTPSIIDVDLRFDSQAFPTAPPTVLTFFGDEDFRSEELLAFEAGYRVRPHDRVSFDVAGFFNLYDD
ncbi:MAG TPA: TonB-dependent receptor, partial [Planctomycetota bacterium]|nr:TonB-dependent receptor [Planctomycetota bacterium]